MSKRVAGEEFSIAKGPVTTTQLVMYAGASGDFNRIHYDPAFAQVIERADIGGEGAHRAAPNDDEQVGPPAQPDIDELDVAEQSPRSQQRIGRLSQLVGNRQHARRQERRRRKILIRFRRRRRLPC